MEHFNAMTIAQLCAMTRHTADPVLFAKNLLVHMGEQLSEAAREELGQREERLKLMKRETKQLAISFEQ